MTLVALFMCHPAGRASAADLTKKEQDVLGYFTKYPLDPAKAAREAAKALKISEDTILEIYGDVILKANGALPDGTVNVVEGAISEKDYLTYRGALTTNQQAVGDAYFSGKSVKPSSMLIISAKIEKLKNDLITEQELLDQVRANAENLRLTAMEKAVAELIITSRNPITFKKPTAAELVQMVNAQPGNTRPITLNTIWGNWKNITDKIEAAQESAHKAEYARFVTALQIQAATSRPETITLMQAVLALRFDSNGAVIRDWNEVTREIAKMMTDNGTTVDPSKELKVAIQKRVSAFMETAQGKITNPLIGQIAKPDIYSSPVSIFGSAGGKGDLSKSGNLGGTGFGYQVIFQPKGALPAFPASMIPIGPVTPLPSPGLIIKPATPLIGGK